MKFKLETEFHDTEIGKIPREWKIVKLKEILTLRNGKRPTLSEEGWVPVYGANGIMGYTADFLIDNDYTIVIGRVGASGEVHLAQGKIWVSDNALYSEKFNSSKVFMPFLYYLLKDKKLSRFAHKTTHPIITQSFLNNLPIQLPSLAEQQIIAEILSTVDRAIEVVDAGVVRLEGLKKALMRELLTGRIRVREENGKPIFYRETEFQDTEIGKIPREWKIKRLGHIIKYVKGRKPNVLFDERLSEEFVPYLTAEYMRGLDRPKWCNTKLESNVIRVSRDDVIMIWDGSYSGHVFTGFDGALASTMIRIMPSIEVNKKFLYYYLMVNFEKFRSTTVGTGIPHVNKKVFEEFPIPVPPLHEQVRIAEILSTVDRAIGLYRGERVSLERLKRGLMDLLLTGRVRVVRKG